MIRFRLVRGSLIAGTICLIALPPFRSATGQIPLNEDASGRNSRQVESDNGAGNFAPVREEQPEVYYFKDRDGKFIPVPDITFEEMKRLLDIDRGLKRPNQPATFSITQLSVEGTAATSHARLRIEAVIQVRVAHMVAVPLLLDGFVLQQPAEFDGPGDHLLDYRDQDGGYIVWIHAPENTVHTVTLEGLVPLFQVGLETRMRLNAPHAVSPELRIKVPTPEARASIIEGAGFLSESTDNGQTELNVQGLRGILELSWRPKETQMADVPTVMEVRGQILVTINGPDEFQSEARLRVRSFGQLIDTFQVRLPPGHELVKEESTEYTVTTLNPQPGTPSASKIVEVRLRQKTEGPDTVILRTLLTEPQGEPGAVSDVTGFTEVAGFEVINALRQSGEIALSVAGDWSLDWNDGHQIRRVGELIDPPWPDKLHASFEYFRQPCSLKVRVQPMVTQVSVQPAYVLRVDQHHVQLHAVMKYTVHGAPASFLKVDLEGWQVESVQSGGRIDYDSLHLDEVAPLKIPLADITPGEFTVELRARKPIDSAAQEVSLALPHPHATSLTPAFVAIVPAKNLQLTPRPEKMPFLTATTSSPEMVSPEERIGALFYRDRGDREPSRFVSDIHVRPAVVLVDVESQLRISRSGVKVQQTFAYVIQHEAVDVLGLYVPPQLAARGAWNLSLDGQTMDPQSLSTDVRDGEQDRPHLVLVRLPEPRDGRCRLQAIYELPAPQFVEGVGTPVSLPLIMPSQDETGVATSLRKNLLSIEPTGITVSPVTDSPWSSRDAMVVQASGSELALAAQARVNQVDFIASLIPSREPISTVVQRAFVQTWLMQRDRQDRALFRLWTSESFIRLTFPPGVDHDAVQVLLDGEPTTAEMASGNELVVMLPGSKPDHHVLELIYPFSSRPRVGSIAVEIPKIQGTKWIRQIFWQVITPAREHLLLAPSNMTSEDRWGWQGFYWRRHSVHEQRDLEQWIGGSFRHGPSESTNQYLFSSFGSIDRFEIRTVSRQLLLAACSGVVLVVGFALIYFPLLRNPATLLGGTVALFFVGVLFPTPALIAIQAGAFGLTLVVLARLLLGIIGRRRTRGTVIRGTTISTADSRSTELVFAARRGNSHVSSNSRRSTALVPTSEAKP